LGEFDLVDVNGIYVGDQGLRIGAKLLDGRRVRPGCLQGGELIQEGGVRLGDAAGYAVEFFLGDGGRDTGKRVGVRSENGSPTTA